MSVIVVLMNTTREKGLHARPNQTLPEPPTMQFTNEYPVFSFEALPCAVRAPLMIFAPGATGFAIETNWQFCVRLNSSHIIRSKLNSLLINKQHHAWSSLSNVIQNVLLV